VQTSLLSSSITQGYVSGKGSKGSNGGGSAKGGGKGGKGVGAKTHFASAFIT